MLAIYLSPLYLGLHGFLLWRIQKWSMRLSGIFRKKYIRITVDVLYLLICVMIALAFLMPEGTAKRICTQVGHYWLGISLYMVLAYITGWIFRLIVCHVKLFRPAFWKQPKVELAIGFGAFLLAVGMSVAGIVSAHNIQVTHYEIEIDEPGFGTEDLKIALVADLHLGYNIGVDHVEKMVEKINAMEPDLVVMAGDIFDNNYDALEDEDAIRHALQKIRSKYGVYATYGNHDINEKILAGFTFSSENKKESDLRMDVLLQNSNIRLLRDEAVVIDMRFALFGRPDYERPGRGIEQRKNGKEIMQGLPADMPVIVIDHEPREQEELAAAGVDVDLCGHTHDGQTFPLNLTNKLIWDNGYGLKEYGDMTQITTSGVGLFGPFMRLGTKAEVCEIVLKAR